MGRRVTAGWKRLLGVVAVLAAGALAVVARSQVASHAAYERLGDRAWLRSATPDDLRRTAEQSLGWWFGSPHDAFLLLLQHGDRSSVPHIRAALWRRPRGSGSCTWGHAEEAVERLEGAQGDE